MSCPYYKNKSVETAFNNLIVAFGGRPLTEEEFKSASLRDLRSGFDYSAMELAYEIFDMNNGNTIDMAPNGEPSGLFLDLLNTTGSLLKAIKIKARIFTDDFMKNNWTDKKTSKIPLDINGEPFMSLLITPTTPNSIRRDVGSILDVNDVYIQQKLINVENFFGSHIHELSKGNPVSSKDIITNLINKKSISSINSILANVLSKHDVPIIFGDLEYGKAMATITKNGGSVVVIDYNQIRELRTSDAANLLMHEMIHALTVDAIDNPLTEEELSFKRNLIAAYNFFDKLIPRELYNRFDGILGAYILSDKYEFAAEFITNRNAKSLLYEKTVEADKKENGTARYILKKFINSVSNFLFNRKLFKLKQDLFKLFKNLFDNFLFHRAIINKGNITDLQMYDAVYKTFDISSSESQESYNMRNIMFRYLDDFKIHYANLTNEEKENAKNTANKLRAELAEMLNSRIIAIKGTKSLSKEEKIKYTQTTEILVSNLLNSDLNIASALSSLYSITIPQLLEDIEALRSKDNISESEYMFKMHDNFATYKKLFSLIIHALEDSLFKLYIQEEINSLPEIQRGPAIEGLNVLLSQSGDALYVADQGVGYMKNQLSKIIRNIAKDITDETDSDELSTWLSELDIVTHDTYKLIRLLGAKLNSRDITVRSIIHLINKANRKKTTETYAAANDLLKLKEELGAGESIDDLYEKDENDNYTSYLIRYLNYGKALKDYTEFMKKVNKMYDLPENNTSIPSSDELVEFKSFFDDSTDEENGKMIPKSRAWSKHKNEYISRHYERKYLPQYYEAYAGLSEDTMNAMNNIRDRINEIKLRAEKDEKGHILFDKLSKEDWETLQGLYIERRHLSSFINYDGTLKNKNSREYRIAEEILNLNKILYSGNRDYHDKLDWEDARNKKIQELEEKFKDDPSKNLKVQYYIHQWDSRNSRISLKKDGDVIKIWDYIDKETEKVSGIKKEELVFDIGDNGEEYKTNKERIYNILKLYRDSNTGEVDVNFLPFSAKLIINSLTVRNKIIRNIAISKDKNLRIKYNKYKLAKKQVMDKCVKFVRTESHKTKYGNIEDLDVRLPIWATRMVVIYNPEEFVELTPGDGWINKEDREDLSNSEYERLSKIDGNEGMSLIPKESIYKNDKYDKVNNSKTLKQLRDKILSLIKETNNNYYDENKLDPYRLPLISGSMARYIKSQKWNGAFKYLREQVGFVDEGQGIRQDDSYGSSILDILNSVTDFQTVTNNLKDLTVRTVVGESADGRKYHAIPIRYVSPLSDPSLISNDLIRIVCEYYNSGLNFKYKDEIKDKVESLIDMLQFRTYEKSNLNGGVTKIEGEDTETYKSARKAADMFLYGLVTDLMRAGNIEFSKVSKLAQHATTAINLGANPAVAITGFFSSLFAHTINSIVGDQNYDIMDATSALGITIVNLIKTRAGFSEIGNQKTDNKTTAFMELFNLVNQLDKKYKKSHLNRGFRIFSDNYVFGMLSATDFIIKSNIMTTMLLSHHYYKGKFVSKEDLFADLITKPDENIISEWKNGISAWEAAFVEDGKIKILPEYEEAFNNSIDLLYERIIYVAEKADGVATETLKAEITTNFLGAAAMIHRLYLPLQWQDRVSSCVYNMDTKSYQQGSFNTFFVLPFACAYASYIEAFSEKRKQEDIEQMSSSKLFLKLYKQHFKDWFSYKDEEGNLKSKNAIKLARAHRLHVKKVLSEFIAGIVLFDMLIPLIFAGANDPDEKDALIYQFNAYVARRVLWESLNAYNPSDAFANIRTLTAETSLIDKVESVVINGGRSLYNVFSSNDSLEKELIYQSGVYKGKNKFAISLFKLLVPYHNVFEQYLGSRAKRRYYENNVMKLDKSEQWVIPLSSSTEE